MKRRYFLLFLLLAHLPSPQAFSAPVNQWIFSSQLDRFKISYEQNRYVIGNQEVDLGVFSQFTSLFDLDLAGECSDLPDKPDLTVKAVTGSKSIRRQFYIRQKVVSDGTYCGALEGEGIFYLPLHRNWYTGSTDVTIALRDSFEIHQDGGKVLHFVREKGEWHNKMPDFYVDWNHFKKFTESLKKFPIYSRAHPSLADDAPSFSLIVGSKTYKFSKVGKNLWAVQLPKIQWLVTNQKWAFWDNMQLRDWQDRHTPQLRQLNNASLPPHERLQGLSGLGSHRSKAIKMSYHRLMLDPQEKDEVKMAVADKLKIWPTDENFALLVDSLAKTQSRELQHKVTRILRLRNPSGALINIEDSDEDAQKRIRTWKQWSKKKSRSSN